MHSITQNVAIDIVLDTTDIDGTNVTTKYLEMADFGTITFFVELGTTLEGTADGWAATDILSSFYLKQATTVAGAGAKAISGATCNQTAVAVAGNKYAITLNTEALDVANDFSFVAAYLVESVGASNGWATVVAMRYNSRFMHEDLSGLTDQTHV